MSVNSEIKGYLKRKVDVLIFHNNETGEWLWSVVVDDGSGFWLNSFKSEKAAMNYCQRHMLQVTRIQK